jgi:hypothetical protein
LFGPRRSGIEQKLRFSDLGGAFFILALRIERSGLTKSCLDLRSCMSLCALNRCWRRLMFELGARGADLGASAEAV